MGVKTSGETMQSLNNASRRCVHVRAIFSPPQPGISKRDDDWKRLIQQWVARRNGGAYSRYMKVEDVPVRITHVEGAMPPGLRRQLLDPLDLEAFESRVLPLHIGDFQLNQD